MCTVTWLRHRTGFHLLCNRDEQRTRGPATAPAIRQHNGVDVIAPTDTDSGGTWIAVNESGLALCVLNGVVTAKRGGAVSRGRVIPDLVGCISLPEALQRIRTLNFRSYLPFTLLLVETTTPAYAVTWDGLQVGVVAHAEPTMLFTSSSWQPDAVCERRHDVFQRTRAGCDVAALRAFHFSHENGPGPHSVCMHRTDAETVSFTEISVDDSSISMGYSPAAPCLRVGSVRAELTLACAQ